MLRLALDDEAQKPLLKDCRPGCWDAHTGADGRLHVNNGERRLQWAAGGLWFPFNFKEGNDQERN